MWRLSENNSARLLAPHVHTFTVETNQRKETFSIKIRQLNISEREREREQRERVDVGPRKGQGQQRKEKQKQKGQSAVVVEKQYQCILIEQLDINKEMTTENVIGVQTRAMTEVQCMEDGAHRELVNNQEQVQGANPITAMGQETLNPGTQNPAMNPTVDLRKANDEAIKELIRRQGTISLDWYVPNFCNTQVGDLVKERLPIETTRGRILFNCPPLSEYFYTSTFKLDLTTGRVYTFLTPPENTMPARGI